MKRLRFPNPKEKLKSTGERYVSSWTGNVQHEHYHRYLFAAGLCSGKRVLDVASGEGYGCQLISQVAEYVVGVDLDVGAVEYAQRTYGSPSARFVAADATKLPFDDASFDIVTSFETIEHLQDHDAFLSEVKRVLHPDGLLVISSPNRIVYTEKNSHENPFHVHELDRDEFVKTLDRYFKKHSLMLQRPICGSVLIEEKSLGHLVGF